MLGKKKTSFKRPIDVTEDLDTSISFYCDLQCENLTDDMVCQALSLLRQHHPYFRLRAEKIDGKIWLVEEEIGDLPLTWLEGISENWKTNLSVLQINHRITLSHLLFSNVDTMLRVDVNFSV